MKHLLLILLCLSTAAWAKPHDMGRPLLVQQINPDEAYAKGMAASENGDWMGVWRHLGRLVDAFPDAPQSNEARYHLAVAYFNLSDFDLANRQFSEYLKRESGPRRFEEVFQYKLAIADGYAGGSRRHLFGSKALPRWGRARKEAVEVYDEIITSLPSHEMAAQSLWGKGDVLIRLKEPEEAIEALQTLILRFPKHDYAPAAYQAIGELYLERGQKEPHDPDTLGLAQINLRRFRQSFPTDQRLLHAEETFYQLRQVIGDALVETGQFYERKGKPGAAAVYYANAIHQYSDTPAAEFSEQRLADLGISPEQALGLAE